MLISPPSKPSLCPFIQRAMEDVDTQETRTQIQKHGHKGIITMDQESQMESVTTLRANFTPPKGPGVRLRGTCLSLTVPKYHYNS